MSRTAATTRQAASARQAASSRTAASARQSTTFSPDYLPGMVFWLKSDVGITTVSGAISSWADQSGKGHDATQGTPSARPVLQSSGGPNNYAYVDFSTAQNLTSAFSYVQPEHIFLVAKKGVPSENNPSFFDGGAGVGNRMRLFFQGVAPGNNNALSMTSNGVNIISIAGTFTDWNIIEALFAQPSGKIRVNNSAYTTGAIGTGNGGGFRLNDFGSGGGSSDAKYTEVIGFDRVLSSAESTAIQSYLNGKYAIY